MTLGTQLVVLSVVCAGPAAAEPAESAEPADRGAVSLGNRAGNGVLTNDSFRYGQRWNLPVGLLLRSALDLVSIPSSVVNWDVADWTVAAATVGGAAVLALPLNPQLDVRIQRSVQQTLGGEGHFKIWTPYGDMVIWTAIYSALAGVFLYGLTVDQPEYVEAAVLSVEAFAVMQAFHWSIKAVVGRDGPEENRAPGALSSEGTYRGPAGFTPPFGSGMPSGHVGSMFAIVSVLMHYFDSPALWVGLNLLAGVFCVTIIADNYHFLSEVLVGGVMGFAVGRWVVEHRSSRYRNTDDGVARRVWRTVTEHATLAPMVVPGGGAGGAVVVRF